MIAWGIKVKRALASSVPVDSGIGRSPENHIDRNHLRSRKTHQHQNRSRSHGYDDHGSDSPEERRTYNAAMDAMSRALQRAAQSPFSN